MSVSQTTLFDERDLQSCVKKIQTIEFGETREVRGIRFTAALAGHVLGAAMFSIDVADNRVLYTGDYCRRTDRHLPPAQFDRFRVGSPQQPHILIMESTFGAREIDPQDRQERKLLDAIQLVVQQEKGKVLIPVFALGRTQELLLILDEHWSKHDQLHSIPIYHVSSLAKRSLDMFSRFTSSMNRKMQQRCSISNPFQFQYIKHIQSIDDIPGLSDSVASPCVILSSPGMMQNGPSRQIFERIAGDARNAVILSGYSVDGSLAKQLSQQPENYTTLAGATARRLCSIHEITFAAHADVKESLNVVDELHPERIIFVHGQPHEMGNMRTQIQSFFTRRQRDFELQQSRALKSIDLNEQPSEQMIKAEDIWAFELFEPANGDQVVIPAKAQKLGRC